MVLKSTIWNKRKKETSNQNRMKKQEFKKKKKMRRSLETSRTTLNVPIFESYVFQKNKSKKLKTYLNK